MHLYKQFLVSKELSISESSFPLEAWHRHMKGGGLGSRVILPEEGSEVPHTELG